MPVLDEPVVLPRLAFLTAWRMLDLGDAPAVLGTDRHHWIREDAVRELEDRTMAALTRLGLARNHRLNDLWRGSLRILAHADHEFYSWSEHRDGGCGAVLIAARGEEAVRLVADDAAVLIEPVRPTWLATSLLDALPDADGASVPDQQLPDHALPAWLEQAPRDAVHQLYTARRTRDGRIRSRPLTALDLTDGGRVLTYPAEDRTVVLTSGTPQAIVTLLNETHTGLG
ncbi:ESX secretion-associated protein EspG [Amycolatopsis sp. WQ 127309]|uniref:ESX secretion-associated protein EspG n=1 Tax=Amycolatopsis sp. WQ 127309 TaxID=2932773 RepID=UPI001FF40086|nr:ESX secretion-associated protein EspG [Amycolatopsis sp. WQ 127309]UOZ03539.1 ESX secretion-associated protein EspG [Amycolatopsis sp. WQ 127309]